MRQCEPLRLAEPRAPRRGASVLVPRPVRGRTVTADPVSLPSPTKGRGERVGILGSYLRSFICPSWAPWEAAQGAWALRPLRAPSQSPAVHLSRPSHALAPPASRHHPLRGRRVQWAPARARG